MPKVRPCPSSRPADNYLDVKLVYGGNKKPLANVKQILSQIRESARVYGSVLNKNEAATRAVLIDPLLRCLGWDTGNPYMVEVERTLDQSQFDYALLDMNQEIKILVEAKKFGSDLSNKDTFMALVKYAYSAKIENIFLTDGIIWHHFVRFQVGNTKPDKILSVDKDDLVAVAVYFVENLDAAKYWDEENTDKFSQDLRQMQGEVNTIKTQIAKLSNPQQTSRVSEPNIPLPVPEKISEKKFTSLSKVGRATNTKPQEFKLPDESVIDVTSWTDVLVQSFYLFWLKLLNSKYL